jgi:hypothetical protein
VTPLLLITDATKLAVIVGAVLSTEELLLEAPELVRLLNGAADEDSALDELESTAALDDWVLRTAVLELMRLESVLAALGAAEDTGVFEALDTNEALEGTAKIDNAEELDATVSIDTTEALDRTVDIDCTEELNTVEELNNPLALDNTVKAELEDKAGAALLTDGLVVLVPLFVSMPGPPPQAVKKALLNNAANIRSNWLSIMAVSRRTYGNIQWV